MRKSELGYILDRFSETGMNAIQDFEWEQNGDILSITYKREPKLFFEVTANPEQFSIFQVRWTGYNKSFPGNAHHGWISTKGVSEKLNDWVLRDIKGYVKEASLPDPLEELKRQAKIDFNFSEQDEREKLSEQEKVLLRLRLSELKKALEERIPLNEEGKVVQEEQFNNLDAKLDELTRGDLKAVGKQFLYDLSINVTANVIVEVGAAVVVAQYNETFWQIVIKLFGIVFRS